MTETKIIPFGKYKGQPVEILAQDRPYLDWLLAQDWLRDRYAGIHALIVNNFAEPTETPEHNSLQVMFLDDEFCAAFIKHVRRCELTSKTEFNRYFERGHPGKKTFVNNIVREGPPIDVIIEAWASQLFRLFIEIKPSVGDDYPAVLRQMRASGAEILFTREYIGVGASKDQFVKTFEISGFKVVFLNEIEINKGETNG